MDEHNPDPTPPPANIVANDDVGSADWFVQYLAQVDMERAAQPSAHYVPLALAQPLEDPLEGYRRFELPVLGYAAGLATLLGAAFWSVPWSVVLGELAMIIAVVMEYRLVRRPKKVRNSDPGARGDAQTPVPPNLADRYEHVRSRGGLLFGGRIATKHPAFEKLLVKMETAAKNSKRAVLLLGDSGAGKSVLARIIYDLRSELGIVAGDFIAVNCAELRSDLGKGRLFGYKKGAFTGAIEDHVGLLARARRGVLFLDEIGDLGLEEQALLLLVLDQKVFTPLGGEAQTTDCMVVAATCKDLKAMVATGQFRADLYNRLATWSFHIPALVQRKVDMPEIVDMELTFAAKELGRERVQMMTPALEAWLAFAMADEAKWPGNYRELGDAIHRMAAEAEDGWITIEAVEEQIAFLRESWAHLAPPDPLAGRIEPERLQQLNGFDRNEGTYLVRSCDDSPTVSDAWRTMFMRPGSDARVDTSQVQRALRNFGLTFESLRKTR